MVPQFKVRKLDKMAPKSTEDIFASSNTATASAAVEDNKSSYGSLSSHLLLDAKEGNETDGHIMPIDEFGGREGDIENISQTRRREYWNYVWDEVR